MEIGEVIRRVLEERSLEGYCHAGEIPLTVIQSLKNAIHQICKEVGLNPVAVNEYGFAPNPYFELDPTEEQRELADGVASELSTALRRSVDVRPRWVRSIVA